MVFSRRIYNMYSGETYGEYIFRELEFGLPHKISNDELVESYNQYVDLLTQMQIK